MIGLLASAWAFAPPSGLHVPQWGGPLASVAEPGVAGLVANPAAAASPTAAMLDVGFMFSSLKVTIDGKEPSGRPGLSLPIPHLAGVVALTDTVGLGARVDAPYVRIGGSDPEGPLRYYSIEGNLVFVEEGLSVAWRPTPAWALGGEVRFIQGNYDGYRSYDLGVTITQMLLPDDYGVPLEDPALEGTIAYEDLVGRARGASLGVSYTPDSGPSYHLAWRSGSTVVVDGTLLLVPSQSFEVLITGELETEIQLPAELWLATRIPIGEVELEIETGWIDYSANDTIYSTAENLTLSATDPGLLGLLNLYGLTEEGLLATVQEQYFSNGYRDVYSMGGVLIAPLAPTLDVRAGAWLATAATPTDYVTPGNLDFITLDLRTVIVWERDRLTLTGSADYYAAGSRTVQDSVYSIYNDPTSGLAGAPGNGKYSLTLLRGGVGATWRF